MLILFQPDYEPSLIEYPSQRLKIERRALTANENRERKKSICGSPDGPQWRTDELS